MDHKEFKEKIALYFYEELSQSERVQFEEHKIECEECSKEYDLELSFLRDLEKNKFSNVDNRILSSARYQLKRALRDETQLNSESSLDKLFSFLFTPYRIAFSAVTVLIFGILLGYILFGQVQSPLSVRPDYGNIIPANEQFTFDDQVIRISNIHFIDADASDGEIEFEFEAVKPVRLKGSVNDPQIQAVLACSMLNNQNPGSRLNSINVMDSKPQLKIDSDVKNTLLTVMLTDENPGVRLEALKVVKRLPYDESIKQAFLTVLATDTTSGLRIEAINALSDLTEKGFSLTQNELTLFKEKFSNDENNYIKFKTRTILQEYN